MAIIEYDPNTGKKLTTGQIVFDPNSNKYIQQGTQLGTYVDPVVQYNPDTGAKLATGEKITYDGKDYTAGDKLTSANAWGDKGDIVNYNTDTGAMLQPGQTTTYNGQIVYQGQKLPAAIAPTSAGTITPMGSTQLPSTSPNSFGIAEASGSNTGMAEYFNILSEQQKTEDQIRQQIAQSQAGKAESSFLSKLLNRESPDEIRKNAFAETGIDPKKYFAEQKARIAEIETLTQEYNAIKAQKEQAIAGTQDKLASNSFINNQIAQIERNAAPKLNELSANINAKVATMQAMEGNYQEAVRYVNMAVDAATEQYRYNLEMYSLFKQQNEETFNRVAKPYQQAFEFKLAMVEQEYRDQRAEKEQMGDLLISAAREGVDLSAYMTGSLDQMLQAYAGGVSSVQRTGGSTGSTGGTGTTGGYKFTNTQLNSGANKAGLSLTAFQALNPEVQNFFVSTSATQIKAMTDALSQPGAAELIDSSTLPPAVKEYFKSQITSSTQSSGGGFGSTIYNTAVKAGDFLIDEVGGAVNNVWSGIKRLWGGN